MNITLDQTYTIKISNGDEIVARITHEDDDEYHISRPLVVVPSPQGIQMIFGMFTADPDKNPTVNTDCVAMYSETDESVRMKYIEATTGIKVPEKKIIMG